MEVEVKAEVCEALSIMTKSLNDKYLGLPALVGADEVIASNILLIELQNA